MRIGIVGAGIAGLAAAYRLDARHDVTLFDAAPVAGGHAHTVEVEHEGRLHAVDTGFVVYNEVTYPRLTALFAELGVATRASDMSFSVRDETTGLEYGGANVAALFARRRNFVSPRFWRMLAGIARFHRDALRLLGEGPTDATLGDLLERGRFSEAFVADYLTPMVGSIWSTPAERMLDAPAVFVLRFLANHGLLSVDGHLAWRTVAGGSRSYVDALVARLRRPPRLATPVARIERSAERVDVELASGRRERFDEVVLAVHADQALGLLGDADDAERRLLSAIPYAENAVTLHTDSSLLPRRRAARASWNYHAGGESAPGVRLTYDMSRLQGLDTRTPLLVTLNRDERIDVRHVLARFRYAHPRFETGVLAAQAALAERNGLRRTWFCGAWTGYGFHEDGLASAESVVARLLEERAA